ncbi:Mor transcription activator family protein [Thiomicrorhabdus indica]|uniref:Mor transcription activator family protein n=1 Tax=Thiomicrorhabdus indica TaxID=2267253 RepID=UPI002AA8D919|nr:Mor transcription activator family protein [Thiomicrorhabdus indica]
MSKQATNQDLFGEKIHATVNDVLKHIDGLEFDDIKSCWPQRMVELYEVISIVLEKQSLSESENHQLSAILVKAIGEYFGGQSFYLPRNQKMERFMRDIAIYKEFTGDNIAELAKKYKVTHQTVYVAIAKQRDLRQKKLPLE